MAFRSATASDYAELLKTKNRNASGVSEWESLFLKPLQQNYSTARDEINKKTSYDISSAFANYKKQQLNLMQNTQLMSGTKREFSSDLKNQYDSAYYGAKMDENNALKQLQKSYLSDLATENKRLAEQGNMLARLEESIYDYTGVDKSKLDVSRDSGGLGYYKTTDKGVELTEYGKQFFDKALHDVKEGTNEFFNDYLYQNDKELFDYYNNYKGDVNELIAGLNKNDMSYDDKDYIDESTGVLHIDKKLADEKYEKTLKEAKQRNKNIVDVVNFKFKGAGKDKIYAYVDKYGKEHKYEGGQVVLKSTKKDEFKKHNLKHGDVFTDNGKLFLYYDDNTIIYLYDKDKYHKNDNGAFGGGGGSSW